MLDEWLAGFTFSRSVRHAARDFSDAVLMAELLAQLLPAGAVDLHNYPSAGRIQQKLTNWETLNRKVLAPMRCETSRQLQEDLANAVPGAVALLLIRVKKIADKQSPLVSAKPPLSPTKRASVPADLTKNRASVLSIGGSTSVLKHHNAAPFSQTKESARQSANGSRRPSVTTPVKRAVSTPTRSLPSSPRPSSVTQHHPHPRYSLLDYLPASNERPNPETLASTFLKVLQITKPRNNKVRQPTSPQPVKSMKPACDRSPWQLSRESGRQERVPTKPSTPLKTKPTKMLSIRSDLPGVSKGSRDARLLHPREPVNAVSEDNSQSTEITEGAFVKMNCQSDLEDTGDGDEQVARIVQTLQSGDCLIQLFKPLISTSPEPAHATPRSFISTSHFIECCSSQLQTLAGMIFDSRSSSWAMRQESEETLRRPCAWQPTPAFRNVSTPPRSPQDYKTTPLSRHIFSNVAIDEPLSLCAITPALVLSTEGSPSEPPVTLDGVQLDLCPPPTVFPPVQLDVSALLSSPPPRFPLSPSKSRP